MADRSGTRGRGIARPALLVAVLTALSTVLGLGRDIVVGAVFGAGAELDAYLVAQGLMNLVMALIAGAMAKSAIPTVAREVDDENGAEAARCRGHRGFDAALTLCLGVLGIGSLVMALAARPVSTALAPGFTDGQLGLTAELTRIMLISTVLISGTDLLAGLAQAHGRYFYSAVQGIPFNLVMIVAATVFGPSYGVAALAAGFVIGSALRLLLQLVPLRQLRIPVRFSVAWADPGFREIVRLVPPIMLGSAVANVNTMVDRAIGSTLGDGAITALSYAWRLIHLPETVLVAALLVPLYPAMSAAAGESRKLAELVGRGASTLITTLVPLTVVFIVAAVPVVSVAFEHGSFDRQAVSMTATALAWYAPAVLAVALRIVFSRACYSAGDSSGPLVMSVIAMVLNVIGDLALAPVMGVAGLALATTLSLVVAAAGTGWLLRRRHSGLDVDALWRSFARVVVAGALAGLAGFALLRLMPTGSGFIMQLLALLATGLVVLGAYAACLRALRAPELSELTGVARGLLRRR